MLTNNTNTQHARLSAAARNHTPTHTMCESYDETTMNSRPYDTKHKTTTTTAQPTGLKPRLQADIKTTRPRGPAKYGMRPRCPAAYHRHRTTTAISYTPNTPERNHTKTVSTKLREENVDIQDRRREFKQRTPGSTSGTFLCEEVPAQQDRMR